MKKTIVNLSFVLLALTFGCSSDGNLTNDEPQIERMKLKSFIKDTDTCKISYTNNKPTTITKPDNTTILLDYNLSGKLIQFGAYWYNYDVSGKIIRVLGNEGICNFVYNDQDRIKEQHITTNTQVSITRIFVYNTANELISFTETDDTSLKRKKGTITYNDQGLAIKVVGEESKDNSASFYSTIELRVSYEAIDNPLSLFIKDLGFTSDVVPLFNNPLSPKVNSGIRLGSNDYFLLSYITSSPIKRLTNSLRTESFDYTSINNYPITAKYFLQDDLGIIDVIDYSWEYTID